MNSGPTAERAYGAIKRRIAGHAFRPGDRLDPAQLADALNTSVTPVRNALHLLTGEGLVETRTGDGFHLPAIDPPALEDLYEWNAQVLDLAIRAWAAPPGPENGGSSPTDLAQGTAELFRRVAGNSANIEHARAVASLNDRLYAVRVIESGLLDEGEEELAGLIALFATGDGAGLRRAVGRYHRRRRNAATAVVRGLYRLG